MTPSHLTLLLAFVAGSSLTAADLSYDSGFEPKSPVPFPETYKDYQILPATMSPGRQYALIYPKRSVLFDVPQPKLLLIDLEHFRVVLDIPVHESLAHSAKGSYAVNWEKDSSAAIVIADRKWGPAQVFLIPLRDGRAGKTVDLAAEVHQGVESDFKESKASRYNAATDFVFASDARTSTDQNGITVERGWDFDGKGNVIVDCTCTTDPKGEDPNAWTIDFHGVWNIVQSRFTSSVVKKTRPR